MSIGCFNILRDIQLKRNDSFILFVTRSINLTQTWNITCIVNWRCYFFIRPIHPKKSKLDSDEHVDSKFAHLCYPYSSVDAAVNTIFLICLCVHGNFLTFSECGVDCTVSSGADVSLDLVEVMRTGCIQERIRLNSALFSRCSQFIETVSRKNRHFGDASNEGTDKSI